MFYELHSYLLYYFFLVILKRDIAKSSKPAEVNLSLRAVQMYKRKCVREERVYKKYFSFDATISTRIYFSFGASREVVDRFTLRCSCQNFIINIYINDIDRGMNISYKNPPSVFLSAKTLFISKCM